MKKGLQFLKDMGAQAEFVEFCKQVRKRLKNDWDIVIGIDGEEGSGKSTLSKLLGFGIDDNFDILNNVAYLPTYSEMENKFSKLKSFSYFDVDEAAKVLYKLKWMDRLQIRINEMYQTERWQNKATGLCIPRFWDLNEYFRGHRVKIWIHVVARGFAVALVRDDVNIFLTDPWRRRENQKILDKLMKRKRITDVSLRDRIRILEKSKNYFFSFTFPQLPDNLWEEYQKNKVHFRSQQKKVVATMRDVQINVVLSLYFKMHMTQEKISEVLGINQSTVSQWVLRYGDLYHKQDDKAPV